jgi:hypothetical protein
MKKFVMTAVVAGVLAFAGSANAATFVYAGGLIKMGSTGSQVKDLQTCLADMGVNDAKNIDGIFGAKTKAAVMAFQASKAVKVDGVIGPVTGPLYTTACAADMADDEVDVDAFDVTDGDEASLEKYSMNSEDDAEEGQSMQIATIEFDVEDGDVLIERLDLTFEENTSGTADNEPWDVFETLTIMADGKEVAEADLNDEDEWNRDNNPFVFRLTGLDYIVKDGDTAEIEVYLTAQDNVDDIDNADWEIYVADTGIRGIDTAGLTQEIGDDTETVSFGIDSEGGDEDIKIKSSSNDPDAASLLVDEDMESDWFEVFNFKLEAEENDIELEDLAINVTTAGANYNVVVNDVMLDIDGDEFDDFDTLYYTSGTFATLTAASGTTPSGFATLTFDIDGDFTVDADDTVEVAVMVEFKKADIDNDGIADGAYDDAGLETIQVSTKEVNGQGVDDVDDVATVSGETHTLSFAVATVEIISVLESVNDAGDTGFINFKFEVDAADADEDIVFDVTDMLGVDTGLTFELLGDANALDALADESTVSLVKISGDATFGAGAWTVAEGDSATFALNFTIKGIGTTYVELQTVAGITVDEISDAVNLSA